MCGGLGGLAFIPFSCLAGHDLGVCLRFVSVGLRFVSVGLRFVSVGLRFPGVGLRLSGLVCWPAIK